MTCPHTIALGAYLLGALDRDERAELESHLEGCVSCRAELERLAPLPGLLSRLTAEEAAAVADVGGTPRAEDPPAALLDGVLAAVGRQRRRLRLRRTLAAAAVAAALVALAGAGGVLLAGDGDDPVPPPRFVASAWNAKSDVRAAVALRPRPEGTRVDLRLAGVRPGQWCELVARAAGGRSEVVSSWRATYAGSAHVPGSVAIPPERLVAFDVVTRAGRTLVRVPLGDR